CAWYEGANTDLCGPAAALLDNVIAPLQTWEVKGLPIEWLSTQGEDHRTIVLSNNSAQPWTGTVRCRDKNFAASSGIELITDQSIELTEDKDLSIALAPWDIAAYRLNTRNHQNKF